MAPAGRKRGNAHLYPIIFGRFKVDPHEKGLPGGINDAGASSISLPYHRHPHS